MWSRGNKKCGELNCQFFYSIKKNYLRLRIYMRKKIIHQVYFRDTPENMARYLFEQFTINDVRQIINSEIEIL